MSKIIQLYSDKDKKIKAYPKTLASQVYMDDGTTTINSQLDSKAHKTNYAIGNTQTSCKKPKPIVVFTFDDGRLEDYTIMKQLFSQYNFPVTSYVMSDYIGLDFTVDNKVLKGCTVEQLKELQGLGWEIGSHTRTHFPCGSANTITDIEEQMANSQKKLRELGFSANNFAFPQGANTDLSKSVGLKYYKSLAMYRTAIAPNTIPIVKSKIERKALGSYFDYTTSTFPQTDTYEYYKYWVDDAIANNRLTVFCVHPWAMKDDQTQMSHLRNILEYCKTTGVSVMTLDNALSYFDNMIDVKSYNEDGSINNEFLIDANGIFQSSTMLFNKKIVDNNVSNTTPPTYFDQNLITIIDIQTGGKARGFKYDNAYLYTFKNSKHPDGVMQILVSKWSNGISVRTSKVNGTWTDWNDMFMYAETQANASTVQPSDYQLGLTRMDINSSSLGYPFQRCIVYTDKLVTSNDCARQIIYEKWADRVAYRYAKNDGTWSEFKSLPTIEEIVYNPFTTTTTINANTELVVDMNKVVNWSATTIASSSRKLPVGIMYNIYNESGNVKMSFYNCTGSSINMSTNTEFNVKIIT